MKTKLVVLVAIFLMLGLAACKKQKQVVEFDVTLSGDYVVPANTLLSNTTTPITTRINTNIESKLQTFNTKSEWIGEAKPTRVTVAVKAPATQDLNFIRDINIKIHANQQVEAQMGYRWNARSKDKDGNWVTTDSIPPGVKTIELNLNEPNLKNYLMQSYVDVKMNLTPNKNVTPSMTLTTTFTLHVKGINE
jgi:hypothetical protein